MLYTVQPAHLTKWDIAASVDFGQTTFAAAQRVAIRAKQLTGRNYHVWTVPQIAWTTQTIDEALAEAPAP